MLRRKILLTVSTALLPLLPACGRELKVPWRPPEAGPTCPAATGRYNAVYTLRQADGTCTSAKPESHDSVQFDDQGRYVSPVDGLIQCQTAKDGCHLSVRCTSAAMWSAEADIDAELSSDAAEITGVVTVTGSFNGCTKVVYNVDARRAGP